MNEKLIGLYEGFVAQTHDPVAAAVLVLAHVSSRCGDGVSPAEQVSLLNLRQAAEMLGYAPAGLRKLVRQRRIQFSQNGRGPIKFRREWLDEFITSNENGPLRIMRSPAQTRRTPGVVEVASRFGLNPALLKSKTSSAQRPKAA
jgi:hypothetical protein